MLILNCLFIFFAEADVLKSDDGSPEKKQKQHVGVKDVAISLKVKSIHKTKRYSYNQRSIFRITIIIVIKLFKICYSASGMVRIPLSFLYYQHYSYLFLLVKKTRPFLQNMLRRQCESFTKTRKMICTKLICCV